MVRVNGWLLVVLATAAMLIPNVAAAGCRTPFSRYVCFRSEAGSCIGGGVGSEIITVVHRGCALTQVDAAAVCTAQMSMMSWNSWNAPRRSSGCSGPITTPTVRWHDVEQLITFKTGQWLRNSSAVSVIDTGRTKRPVNIAAFGDRRPSEFIMRTNDTTFQFRLPQKVRNVRVSVRQQGLSSRLPNGTTVWTSFQTRVNDRVIGRYNMSGAHLSWWQIPLEGGSLQLGGLNRVRLDIYSTNVLMGVQAFKVRYQQLR